MLLVYTGEGKGKTSAAVGQCVRALGQSLRVGFAQFMKPPGQAGEQKILSELLGNRFFASGAGFYRRAEQFPRHREKARFLLSLVDAWLTEGLDMLLLDEALYALGLELVTMEELESLLYRCRELGCHLVLTGRGCPDWIAAQADLVSEITPIKHPFHSGLPAVKGIEF